MEVSIIISVYNCERYIGRAIRSAIDQSFNKRDYEIIVVDDGSRDRTQGVLKSFGSMVKIFRFQKNKGLPFARNYGIKAALGRYIINLDADDYMHRDLLKIEHLYIGSNEDCDAVGCDYYVVDDKEQIIERKNAKKEPIACGIMFKKDRLFDIGLYDAKFILKEDVDLRLRYEEKFSIHYIKIPLYRYRLHENNMTRQTDKMEYYANKVRQKYKFR